MPFIRVRSARAGDPAHEFDVSVDEYDANTALYSVVDPDPVVTSRPMTAVETVPPPKTAKPRRRKPAPVVPPKPAETTRPDRGMTSEE